MFAHYTRDKTKPSCSGVNNREVTFYVPWIYPPLALHRRICPAGVENVKEGDGSGLRRDDRQVTNLKTERDALVEGSCIYQRISIHGPGTPPSHVKRSAPLTLSFPSQFTQNTRNCTCI